MDFSKLPKRSETPDQTSVGSVPVIPYEPATYRPIAIRGEIWISLVMGIVFLYFGSNFARFATSTLVRTPYHTGINWTSGDREGTEVSYFDLDGFAAWSEMGIFLFGLTLLFEALAKTLIAIQPGNVSRFALMLAIGLTVLSVTLNVIACLKLLNGGITPLLSGLAVAFGGWILLDEWKTLRLAR